MKNRAQILFILLIQILTWSTFAQEGAAPATASSPKIEDPQPALDMTSYGLRSRSRYNLSGHVSPVSTWLPMKMGLALGWMASPDWTLEFEWTRKSISAKIMEVDFGQVVDERYGFQGRWYLSRSNSFHLVMGIFKTKFSFELGPSYLANIPGTPSATVWKFESIGPQLGLANRWQWDSGITFGVDWLLLYFPAFAKSSDDQLLQQITSEADKDDLNRVTSAIKNLPQIDLFRLNLGYSF